MFIVLKIFKVLSEQLLDIFFPKRCVQCGKYGAYVCYECVRGIERLRTSMCPECGRIISQNKFCPQCKIRTKTQLSGLIIASRYEKGPIRSMIHGLKYDGLTEISILLGELLHERVRGNLPSGQLLVVPVPLHRKRLSIRGFNQAELLAEYLAQRLSLPYSKAISRINNTDPQTTLSGSKRRQNLLGAFKINQEAEILGKTILLVDDVATTTSTLNECAKVLRSAGAKYVWGVVVARG